MEESANIDASLLQQEEGERFDETARFEVRSVTGACYTIVEHTAHAAPQGDAGKRYRTAWTNLPVAANDDGSFTIVTTHTRLVRTGPR